MQARATHPRSSARSFSSFLDSTAAPEIYTLSLHDALPICITPVVGQWRPAGDIPGHVVGGRRGLVLRPVVPAEHPERQDRKSTRLNSSHTVISYAVFCLKKKKQIDKMARNRSVHRNQRATA